MRNVYRRSKSHKNPYSGQILNYFELLPECNCVDGLRRGPLGGVCGNCGFAILSLQELAEKNSSHEQKNFSRR